MKITCKHCGIVDKPHKCPHTKKSTNNNRADKKIYRDKRWRALRTKALDNYNNICLWSLYVDGKVKQANVVHHIKEVLQHEELAYDYNNVIPLDYHNHELVHELYKKNKTKVQAILVQMCIDYQNGDIILGKYKDFNYF